ncbi:MAG: hypothetical protein M1820_005958 [Bogoriella megaspora]|nr:MAG: hypothetical protein M1820_005958 [Bogoriella megaspora]
MPPLSSAQTSAKRTQVYKTSLFHEAPSTSNSSDSSLAAISASTAPSTAPSFDNKMASAMPEPKKTTPKRSRVSTDENEDDNPRPSKALRPSKFKEQLTPPPNKRSSKVHGALSWIWGKVGFGAGETKKEEKASKQDKVKIPEISLPLKDSEDVGNRDSGVDFLPDEPTPRISSTTTTSTSVTPFSDTGDEKPNALLGPSPSTLKANSPITPTTPNATPQRSPRRSLSIPTLPWISSRPSSSTLRPQPSTSTIRPAAPTHHLRKPPSHNHLIKKPSSRHLAKAASSRNLSRGAEERKLDKKLSSRDLAKKTSSRDLAKKPSSRELAKKSSSRHLSERKQAKLRHKISILEEDLKAARREYDDLVGVHEKKTVSERRMGRVFEKPDVLVAASRDSETGEDEGEEVVDVQRGLELFEDPFTDSTATNRLSRSRLSDTLYQQGARFDRLQQRCAEVNGFLAVERSWFDDGRKEDGDGQWDGQGEDSYEPQWEGIRSDVPREESVDVTESEDQGWESEQQAQGTGSEGDAAEGNWTAHANHSSPVYTANPTTDPEVPPLPRDAKGLLEMFGGRVVQPTDKRNEELEDDEFF